uniref:Uncharacterized protein n=1 Tax=Avena sativa TaxID=4498 RepID=A0ACD6ACP4_AVESA
MAHPPADRRLRSPPSSASRADCDHHRFLRPGALARLRDSKIVARSLRSAARLLPPSSPPPRSPAAAPSLAEGGVPHYSFGAARGPRYPLRKKLAAARGVVFLPPPPMSPGATEAFLGAFALAPSELVSAH